MQLKGHAGLATNLSAVMHATRYQICLVTMKMYRLQKLIW